MKVCCFLCSQSKVNDVKLIWTYLIRRNNFTNVRCKNYYEVLQVEKSATDAEIKDSFLKLSKKCHPDKNPGSEAAHDEFVKLNEAFSVLKSANSRRSYDSTLGNNDSAANRNEQGVYRNASSTSAAYRSSGSYQFRDKSTSYAGNQNDTRRTANWASREGRRGGGSGPKVKEGALLINILGITFGLSLFFKLVFSEQKKLTELSTSRARYEPDLSVKVHKTKGALKKHNEMIQARKDAAEKNRQNSKLARKKFTSQENNSSQKLAQSNKHNSLRN